MGTLPWKELRRKIRLLAYEVNSLIAWMVKCQAEHFKSKLPCVTSHPRPARLLGAFSTIFTFTCFLKGKVWENKINNKTFFFHDVKSKGTANMIISLGFIERC